MAKTRPVNTRFWRDTYIAKLSPEYKLFFLYLLTNPETTLCGVYEIPLQQIALDLGISQQKTETMMQQLEEDEKVAYIDGWLCLVNHPRYMTLSNVNHRKGVERELSEVPKAIRNRLPIAYGMAYHSHSIETEVLIPILILIPIPKGYTSASDDADTSGDTPKSEKKKRVSSSHKKAEPKRTGTKACFEKFWQIYPKKTQKKSCLQKWQLHKLDPELDTIIDFVEKAKESDRWKSGFVVSPLVFLNQRRWEDDLAAYQDDKTREHIDLDAEEGDNELSF